MNTPQALTPEQTIVLQSFLIRAAEQWQQYQREYPGLLDLASYHVAPDGAWISVEHEEQTIKDYVADALGHPSPTQIIRLSPACTHLVTKI